MKNLGASLKVSFLVLFAFALVAGCKKSVEVQSTEHEGLLIRAWVDGMKQAKYKVDSLTTGVYYVIDTVGTGAYVTAGNTITISYTGQFLDGTTFDFSNSYTYVHKGGNTRMIPGWEDGIEKLNKGAYGTFLIPSSQAYGSNGYLVVPGNTPLLFNIKVINIQ